MNQFNVMPSLSTYPEVFPGLVGEVFHHLVRCGHASGIVGPTLLAMIKLATQDLADIQAGAYPPQLIGLNGMIIAPSGWGKSTLVERLRLPFDASDIEQAHIAEDASAKHKKNHRVWSTKVKAIESKIQKYVEDPVQLTVLQELLARTLDEEPKHVVTPSVICHDTTVEGLLKKLHRWPSAGIILDEAGLWLKNRVARNPAQYIKLLDGSPYRLNRAGAGEIFIPAPRLAVLLMIQNGAYISFRRVHGQMMQDSGFDARFLFSVVEQYGQTNHISDSAMEDVLGQYGQRVTDLLQQSFHQKRQGPSDRHILTLSESASRFLLDQRAYIQEQRRGMPISVDAYAARHVERVVKMVGSWTVFNGCDGPITLDYVQRASALCLHHLEVYRTYMGVSVKASTEMADANLLESQLVTFRYLDPNKSSVFKTDVIRKMARNWGLDKKRFDLAFELLCREARVQVLGQGGGNFFQLAMQRPQMLPSYLQPPVWR